MKDNRVKFENDAVALLKSGVDKLANAVKSTLGPSGKNVIIIENQKPKITKDGVSVAKAVNLEDVYENAGAQIVKEVAEKTLKNVGDNTTTATVLAQALINNGLESINKRTLFERLFNKSNGSKVIKMKKGIDLAVSIVIEELKKQAKKINKNSKQLLQVATISANNDIEVAKVVVDAFKHTGEDGIILIDEVDSAETDVEYVDGVQLPSGFFKEFFINDAETRTCKLENPYILFYNGRLCTETILLPSLSYALEKDRPLVVFAKKICGEAQHIMSFNSSKCCGVEIDGVGIFKKYHLDDLAVVTGGKVYDENDIYEEGMLGQCDEFICHDNDTIIIGGKGDKELIEKQADSVRKLVKDITDETLKETYKKRLARIKGGVATIKVGGYTDIERREKYDRFDDAVCATRAALQEGVVVGGGMAYINCIKRLIEERYKHKEYKEAFDVVIDALQEPFRLIVKNCGANDDIALIDSIDAGYGYGYNGISGKVENLFELGIIDAAMAVRCAIENAASIAGLFLTTECIVDNNE